MSWAYEKEDGVRHALSRAGVQTVAHVTPLTCDPPAPLPTEVREVVLVQSQCNLFTLQGTAFSIPIRVRCPSEKDHLAGPWRHERVMGACARPGVSHLLPFPSFLLSLLFPVLLFFFLCASTRLGRRQIPSNRGVEKARPRPRSPAGEVGTWRRARGLPVIFALATGNRSAAAAGRFVPVRPAPVGGDLVFSPRPAPRARMRLRSCARAPLQRTMEIPFHSLAEGRGLLMVYPLLHAFRGSPGSSLGEGAFSSGAKENPGHDLVPSSCPQELVPSPTSASKRSVHDPFQTVDAHYNRPLPKGLFATDFMFVQRTRQLVGYLPTVA